MTFRFECTVCAEEHVGVPAFGADAPDSFHRSSDADRARAHLDSDRCVIGARHFVRACLDLPTQDEQEPLSFGVWVEADAAAVERRERCVGRLDTRIPGYRDTLGLPVSVEPRELGLRPSVRVTDPDHALARDQAHGVGPIRLALLVQRALHGWPLPAGRAVEDAFRNAWGEPDDIRVFDRLDMAPKTEPPLPRLDVLVWRADSDTDVTSFVTCGMSSRSHPGTAAHRTELHFGVRAELDDRRRNGVCGFLADLACYPWDRETTLGLWHTVNIGYPVPCFPSCSAVLLHPKLVDEGIDRVESSEGEVHVLLVVPITQAERELASEGRGKLIDHFVDGNVDLFTDRG